MKKWFNIFIYISLGFLITALIKADYLKMPEINNYTYIIIGIVLVCIGFVFDAISWHKTLIHFGFREVRVSHAVISMGLSIFGKYVPGKIWTIIGRSAYIAKQYDLSETETAIISLNAQFISFWVGLFFGIVGLLIFGSQFYLLELSLLVWSLFTLLLFSRFFHNIFIKLFRKVLKKEIYLPSLSIKSTIRILPWFLINWLLWCLGFWFLAMGLSAVKVSMFLGLMFALAGTLSLMIIIIPGALGVRESILTTVLVMEGIGGALAITIATTSRLWFLFGEFFIFLIAIILKRRNTRKMHTKPHKDVLIQ
jgi:uncharacterized membrane protein YbhN (UPF0104 family)